MSTKPAPVRCQCGQLLIRPNTVWIHLHPQYGGVIKHEARPSIPPELAARFELEGLS